MSVIPKGGSRKFKIDPNQLIQIIKDNTTYNHYEGKLNSLETKLLNELNENEDYKKNFAKTVINIVEIIENENEKLKGFINGENCHCTSITITILEDGIDILFNEDFNNMISSPKPCACTGIGTSITIEKVE
eukprot:jgi/Orpsp1_1/1183552/evm.model.c7180000085697.1